MRSAITDNVRRPLAAPGLKFKARLEAVADSVDRVGATGLSSPPLARLRQLISRGLERTAPLWPNIERAYSTWIHAPARALGNDKSEDVTMYGVASTAWSRPCAGIAFVPARLQRPLNTSSR